MSHCTNPYCRCQDCQCGPNCQCDHRAFPYPTPFPVPYLPYYRELAYDSAAGYNPIPNRNITVMKEGLS